MTQLTSIMSKALGSMDLVQVNETMQNFEKMFDNLDVNAEFMDRVMDNVNAGSYKEKDVDNLIGQVAKEFSLKVHDDFIDIQAGNKVPQQKVKVEEKEEDPLNKMLADLKN
jgi:hypothetical protein